MHRRYFIKKIDSLLGPLISPAIRRLVPAGKSERAFPSTILIIRPGGIGDAALLIPAINWLRKVYPDAAVDILAEKRNADVFGLSLSINTVFRYDMPVELLRALSTDYDVVIDSEQWHRLSAVIARLTRAPVMMGYATNERKKLFTHPISYSHEDHEVRSFLNLVAPLTGDARFDTDTPFLIVPQSAIRPVRALLSAGNESRFVALFPGGSISERRWGGERFKAVAKKLMRAGYAIAVIGAREDIQDGNIIAEAGDRIMNLCGKLSLVETAAVLKRSTLLITGDSGIMHIAYGLGTRTLALFGPGIEKKWAPRGAAQITINKNLDCSPCTKFGTTPKCTRGVECMKQITVDEVMDKAIQLLEMDVSPR